jgi:GNAT superfamily N-acetyltransferase
MSKWRWNGKPFEVDFVRDDDGSVVATPYVDEIYRGHGVGNTPSEAVDDLMKVLAEQTELVAAGAASGNRFDSISLDELRKIMEEVLDE